MKLTTPLLPILIIAVTVGNAQNGGEKNAQPKLSSVEKALDDAFDQSAAHDGELAKLGLELGKKMEELGERLPKDTKIGQLTQSQRDEWNMMTAQQVYLKKSHYLEVLKRREILQLKNLVRAYKIQDNAYEATLLYGQHSTVAETQAEAERGMHKEFGDNVANFWIIVLKEIDAAQQVTDAQNIPLKGLVERINLANSGFGLWSDALEFVNTNDFPNTPAGQIFLARLLAEVKSGNADAIEAFKYFDSVYHLAPQAPPKK